MNGINKKMTDKEFKEFTRELYCLMQKYNIIIKKGSEEMVFGIEGDIIYNGYDSIHVEREICIYLTEMLTTEQANKEKKMEF